MTESTRPVSTVGQRYLLLADMSGYTGFMAGVENAHGIDVGAEVPPGYALMGELLDALSGGVQPEFAVVKLEGDAVFATAPAATLDGRGADVLVRLRALHQAFRARRVATRQAQNHECSACSLVASLDLKMVLHRGQAVRQTVGSQTELLGTAVNVAHRLLKNTIAARIGYRPYLFPEKAARAWTLPALIRSYPSSGKGREQFADETTILAEHGYQPAMQSSEGGHFRPLLLIAGPSKGKLSVTFTKQA